MDNYYTSPSLFLELTNNGIGACGTARTDRKGMPTLWKQKQGKHSNSLQKSEIRTEFLKNGKLLALQWEDKRLITMLSSIHDSSMVTKTRRTRASASGRETKAIYG